MIVAVTNRPIPVLSAESEMLADFLRTLPAGETISYKELSELIHADVQKRGRGWLQTARKTVKRTDKMLFEAVRGVGLKRLTDEEIALVGRTSLRTINRAARRGLEKSRCIDNLAGLSTQSQLKLYTHLSILATFYQISTGSSIKKIENVVARAPGEIATSAVLGALLGGPSSPGRPVPANA